MRRKLFDYGQWHRWFAWHSVEINGYSVWLETVERKIDHVNEAGNWWVYRLCNDGKRELTL